MWLFKVQYDYYNTESVIVIGPETREEATLIVVNAHKKADVDYGFLIDNVHFSNGYFIGN